MTGGNAAAVGHGCGVGSSSGGARAQGSRCALRAHDVRLFWHQLGARFHLHLVAALDVLDPLHIVRTRRGCDVEPALTRSAAQAPHPEPLQVQANRPEARERRGFGVAVGTRCRCAGTLVVSRLSPSHEANSRGAQAVNQRSGRSSAGGKGIFSFGACAAHGWAVARAVADTHRYGRQRQSGAALAAGGWPLLSRSQRGRGGACA